MYLKHVYLFVVLHFNLKKFHFIWNRFWSQSFECPVLLIACAGNHFKKLKDTLITQNAYSIIIFHFILILQLLGYTHDDALNFLFSIVFPKFSLFFYCNFEVLKPQLKTLYGPPKHSGVPCFANTKLNRGINWVNSKWTFAYKRNYICIEIALQTTTIAIEQPASQPNNMSLAYQINLFSNCKRHNMCNSTYAYTITL